MKNFYLSLLTALLFALPAVAQQHYVYVHGYVKNTNNIAIANKAVKVQADSSGCQITHTKYTNANGFYSDTLQCNTSINLVRTSTENCNGQQLVNVKPVPPSGSVESNFIVCVPNTVTCAANFNFGVGAGGMVQFTNTSSFAAGGTSQFSWSFGDGTGSVAPNPSHIYSANGTYQVMLILNTGNCADSVMKVITITNAGSSCNAVLQKQVNGSVVNFQSGQSTSSDSIVSRYWNYGDGNALSGNTIAPVYTYANNGTYTACLVITSASGCRDTACETVVINTTPIGCVSYFNFNRINATTFTFEFNSTGSQGSSPTDNIIERHWTWGDGTSTTNNAIGATHTYQTYGLFPVCLKIKTAAGCEKTICRNVSIVAPNCDAQFTASVSGNTVAVNSSASVADSNSQIVERIWNWGDGSPFTSGVTATHVYATNGVYTVCLKIRTSSGCIDSICKTIAINSPVFTCEPRFDFQFSTANPRTILLNSGQSTPGIGDSIISRSWRIYRLGTQWMDSMGNVIAPTYTFNDTGRYTICLYIQTRNGCNKSICKDVIIQASTPPATNCEAVYSFTGLPLAGTIGLSVQFNSANSHATSTPNDVIVDRLWNWGDGSTTGGNNVSPIHTFVTAGTYNVCLVIKSASGCRDTVCKTVVLPMNNQMACKAAFTYEQIPNTTVPGRSIRFNSSMSIRLAGDSIISRKWEFGDSSILTGNVVSPVHQYSLPGIYTVCLTITTANGCTSRECKTIIVSQVSSNCTPYFIANRIAAKTVAFNSSASWVPANDTIIERRWNFGNGSPLLVGNVVSPTHTYLNYGVYSVALSIRTARGCFKTFYKLVNVQDSIANPINDPIKIMSLYPNPVSTNMTTVVWSLNNNVQAEVAVYDVYGAKKWSMNKTLLQGNNITVVPVQALPAGPYYFRVTTMYGVRSRGFYKL